MPEVTSYPPGKPCWADVTSPDVDGAASFYAQLFGWEPIRDPRPEAGGYVMFERDGKPVAAASPPQAEGMPPVWTVYLATDDADATAARVGQAGGTVLVEPFDVLEVGRMAVVQDPSGAIVALWQAGAHVGARLRGEPGTINWCECQTHDQAAAVTFYERVFGYETEATPMGPAGDYVVLKVGGEPVAGVIQIAPEWGADIPSNWSVVFEVESCDAAVATAQELGGTVIRPPVDLEGVGRFSVLADPYGAVFQVIT